MVRASGICLEGPGFNPQSGHLFCLTKGNIKGSETKGETKGVSINIRACSAVLKILNSHVCP